MPRSAPGTRPNVGARPCWTGSGETEAQALERAAAGAAYFWDDMAQHGISRTLLDLVYR
jgi:hypothetical protein